MISRSFADIVRNAYSLLITKLFFPKARLVRMPIFLTGKKGIQYGEGLTTGRGCRISAKSDRISLRIGENARIGDYVHINADYDISIGSNVLMASKIFISDTNHGNYQGENQSSPFTNPNLRDNTYKKVIIGDNVWIGENVVILPGSIVGNGCIIGANAVLTGKVYPDNTIIVGIPGRVIKKYDENSKTWVNF